VALTVIATANHPPLANAGGPYTVVRGGTVTLDASGTSDPDQSNATLSYAWDFNGDGVYDDATGMNPVYSTAASTATGTRTVGLRVTDSGGLTGTATATVNVVAAAVLPDPAHLGTTDLVVGGTPGNDIILLLPSCTTGAVDVWINGASVGTFQPTGRVLAYGYGGNDLISAVGLGRTAYLFGGDGNDALLGGDGSNVLVGGNGDDVLTGFAGRDLLIGGAGTDILAGGTGDDILIAGTTAYDADPTSLAAVMAEWTSGHDYLTRVANLRGTGTGASFAGRLNGNVFLHAATNAQGAATVFGDTSLDVLTGGGGRDWYFANVSGGGLHDWLLDENGNEIVDDLP